MTLAKTARPSTSCRDLRVPMTSSRSDYLIFERRRVHGLFFFSLKEKTGFSEMGGLCSLSPVSSLPLQERVLLLVEKGKEAAFAKLKHSQDLLSRECCQMTPADTAVCCPLVEGGRSRNRKNVLKSLKHHKRETKNGTKSTEKSRKA